MPERHTIDFDRGCVNVLSDADRGTITLRSEGSAEGRERLGRIAKGIRRRFGSGAVARLARWWADRDNPLVPSPAIQVEPDAVRYEIGVRPGERMDAALLALFAFFEGQPGYRRTLGSPLDRDSPKARTVGSGPKDASTSAHDILRDVLRRHRRPTGPGHPETTQGPAKPAGPDPDF